MEVLTKGATRVKQSNATAVRYLCPCTIDLSLQVTESIRPSTKAVQLQSQTI